MGDGRESKVHMEWREVLASDGRDKEDWGK